MLSIKLNFIADVAITKEYFTIIIYHTRFLYRNSTGTDTLPCTDIDECALYSTLCTADEVCSNTVGSYECLSPRGSGTQGV